MVPPLSSQALKQRRRFKDWSLALILLFVSSQTAGLLHAEIHPFHEHEASCDVLEHLANPIDHIKKTVQASEYLSVEKVPPVLFLTLVIKHHQHLFYGRAPPYVLSTDL